MSDEDLVALVDRLRALPTETEWCEFKRNRHARRMRQARDAKGSDKRLTLLTFLLSQGWVRTCQLKTSPKGGVL